MDSRNYQRHAEDAESMFVIHLSPLFEMIKNANGVSDYKWLTLTIFPQLSTFSSNICLVLESLRAFQRRFTLTSHHGLYN